MRLSQLRCHTARENHVYRKFTWGNRRSLVSLPVEKGIDVRLELVNYYKCVPLSSAPGPTGCLSSKTSIMLHIWHQVSDFNWAFLRQHYGAERMSLAVIGGEPLDLLQQWVVDLFAAVPVRGAPRPTFSDAGPPYEVIASSSAFFSGSLLTWERAECKTVGSCVQPAACTSSERNEHKRLCC